MTLPTIKIVNNVLFDHPDHQTLSVTVGYFFTDFEANAAIADLEGKEAITQLAVACDL